MASQHDQATGAFPDRAPDVEWWARGRESASSMAALALAVTLSLVVLNSVLSDSLGLLFDLGFVALCCALALRVRMGEFVYVGLIPPLALIAVFALLGFAAPDLVAQPQDGVVQVVVTGLGHHSAALFVGYALCLTLLAYRYHLSTTRP